MTLADRVRKESENVHTRLQNLCLLPVPQFGSRKLIYAAVAAAAAVNSQRHAQLLLWDPDTNTAGWGHRCVRVCASHLLCWLKKQVNDWLLTSLVK